MSSPSHSDPAARAALAACPPRLVPPPEFGPRPGNTDFALGAEASRGQASVAYDFAGVDVGTAEYAQGPTGVTVVHIPAGARTAVDARGGSVGMVGGYDFNHAICLAGGSVYGLAAAAGVSEVLLEQQQNRVGWDDLQSVSGAIIYDFGARSNAVVPDVALGRAALAAACHGAVPIGRCGAGCSASVGKVDARRSEFAGQGAAFREVGEIKLLALSVVNAVGVIVDRDGTVVLGNYDTETGERRHPATDYHEGLANAALPVPALGNTTLTVVVTNARLTDRELGQFARQVHGSMHRAIQPFHTDLDGDTLFAVTTDEVDLPRSRLTATSSSAANSVALAAVASEVVWDAVLTVAR